MLTSAPAPRCPAKVEALGALLQAIHSRPSRASTLAVEIGADILARFGLLVEVSWQGAISSSLAFAGLVLSFATLLALVLGPGVRGLLAATRRRVTSLLPLSWR